MCAAPKRKTAASKATIAPSAVPPRSHGRGLRVLLRAFDEAARARQPAREFAVERRACDIAGVSTADLRWLVSQNFAVHLIETTPETGRRRTFRTTSNLAFGERSCFVLTPAGVELARRQAEMRRAKTKSQATMPRQQPNMPHWDAQAKKLWLGTVLVKRFMVPAENQERILAALEEEGWPTHIDDPLPPRPPLDPKRRLGNTIVKLNRHQQHPLIRFRGDGTGKGVCWERVGES